MTSTHTSPERVAAPATSGSAGARLLDRVGTDTRYLLAAFPVALTSFVTLVAGFSLGVGLLVVVIGLPVLAATLRAARGLADLERLQLAKVSQGRELPRPVYRRPDQERNAFRRALTPLTQAQSWLDLAHGVATFVVSTVTFVLTVTWWALAAGGLTYWFWERFLPAGGNDVVVRAVLGSYSYAGEVALFTAVGLGAAVTLPAVLRALTTVRSGLARVLLVDLAAYRGQHTP